MEKINMDEGFAYGIGAFETIAIKEGTPLFLAEHLARLEKACAFFGIENSKVDSETVCKFLAKKSREATKNAALKIMVSAENIIFALRENTYTEDDFQRGFRLCVSTVQRNETSPLVFVKSLSFAENIIEKRKAVAAGFDEALFLNSKGQACEGTSSNIFLIKDGELFTPAQKCGLLPGIVRDWVMQEFSASETEIKKEELKTYDAAFLTNSLMGIMPITSIDSIAFEFHPLIQKIAHRYQEL